VRATLGAATVMRVLVETVFLLPAASMVSTMRK
jgi:hypothetical protein